MGGESHNHAPGPSGRQVAPNLLQARTGAPRGVEVTIERFRDRIRAPAPVNPRPDGISRRVAMAARDRQLGPLPEQRPTGWHRLVFDNPPRRDPPPRFRPGPDPAAAPGPGAPVAPPGPGGPVSPASSQRPADPRTPDRIRSAQPDPGAGSRRRLDDPPRRQIGRVLDIRPDRGRRRRAVAIAAAAAAVVVAAVAAILATDRAVRPEPDRGPTPSSVVLSSPGTPTSNAGPFASTAASPSTPIAAVPPRAPGSSVVVTLDAG